MKSIGIVLPDLAPRTLKDFYLKKNAKRYYADLDMKVYYFRAHSAYWVNMLRRLEIPLVAVDINVSRTLTQHGIAHLKFNNANSIHELLTSLN